jgi:hypothetical protein
MNHTYGFIWVIQREKFQQDPKRFCFENGSYMNESPQLTRTSYRLAVPYVRKYRRTVFVFIFIIFLYTLYSKLACFICFE